MKKLIYIAIFLQLSISSLSLAAPVYFVDSNLQAAVEAELGITDPTPIDMLGLTHLSANSSEIFDLTGLEYAVDVNELHLSGNLLSDLSDPNVLLPISGLTSLIYLYLNNNQITDISAVSGLENLETLFLSLNQIDDISPLSDPNLIGLTSLYLSGNQISGDDLSNLSGLSNLTVLDLTGNQVDDISVVPDLTSLEELYLSNNQISDLSDEEGNSYMSNLTSLQYLYLSNNQISDLSDEEGNSYMSDLTSLQYLYLDNNLIVDIYGLTGEELNDLVNLSLTGNTLNKASYCTNMYTIKDNNPLVSIDVEGNPYTCLGNDLCSDLILDDLEDPFKITKSYLPGEDNTYSGSTEGATGPEEASLCGLWDYNDVWHFYTPGSDEVVDISLCGSSLDTSLVVFDSCGGTVLACNDDWCGTGENFPPQSLVTVSLTGGQTYLIRVAGYSETTGDYDLIITDAPVPPVNNTCEDAIVIVPYTEVTGSTTTAYGLDITSCTVSDTRGVWYKFIPTISGRYLMDPSESDYDTSLAVFDGFGGCGGTELACNDDYCNYDRNDRCIVSKSRIVLSLDEGVTYYIRISGYSGDGGNYSLTVTLAADIDKDRDVDIFDLDRLLQEWMMMDEEDDVIYVISDADIDTAEADEYEGGGGDRFINLMDFAEVCAQWGVSP